MKYHHSYQFSSCRLSLILVSFQIVTFVLAYLDAVGDWLKNLFHWGFSSLLLQEVCVLDQMLFSNHLKSLHNLLASSSSSHNSAGLLWAVSVNLFCRYVYNPRPDHPHHVAHGEIVHVLSHFLIFAQVGKLEQ